MMLSEAITSGAVSLRQNMHLVKNVMLPVDLVPVRTVLVSLVGEVVSILIVVHISNMPVEAIFAFYFVGAHRTGKLRFDSALVALVLNESTAPGVTAATTWTHIGLVLHQGSRSRIA